MVALAHLGAVRPGHEGGVRADEGLREFENRPEGLVHFDRDITGHFEMLFLVLADRHDVAVVQEDVRRHEHGVAEECMRGGDAVGDFVFVGVAPLEESHGGDRAEDPGEERDLRDVGLAEEEGFGRVEATGEKVEGHVAGVAAEGVGIMQRGERVEVGDEVKGFALVLQFDRGLHHAEVIPEVQGAGGLDAGKDAFHARRGLNHKQSPAGSGASRVGLATGFSRSGPREGSGKEEPVCRWVGEWATEFNLSASIKVIFRQGKGVADEGDLGGLVVRGEDLDDVEAETDVGVIEEAKPGHGALRHAALFVIVDGVGGASAFLAGAGFHFDEDEGLRRFVPADKVDFAAAGRDEIAVKDAVVVVAEVAGGLVLAPLPEDKVPRKRLGARLRLAPRGQKSGDGRDKGHGGGGLRGADGHHSLCAGQSHTADIRHRARP